MKKLMTVSALALALLVQGGCATAQVAQNLPVVAAVAVPPAPAPIASPTVTATDAMAADTAVRKAEIAKLSGLVGKWTGPGWRILPNGTRVEYDQTVLVTSKMGGQAMTIEGASIRRPPTGPLGAGSLAVITWEPRENRYAFRSFTGGRLTDSDGTLTGPDTFVWIVKGPPLGLRFTVKFSGNSWSEIGEVSRDGEKTLVVTYQLEMRKSPTPQP